jgi:hypothetical protein
LQLTYLDDALQRIACDADHTPVGWDAAEVAHFRLVAQCASAATAESDLLTLRLLRIRADSDHGVASVVLSAKRVLLIRFESTTMPMTVEFDVSTVGTEQR